MCKARYLRYGFLDPCDSDIDKFFSKWFLKRLAKYTSLFGHMQPLSNQGYESDKRSLDTAIDNLVNLDVLEVKEYIHAYLPNVARLHVTRHQILLVPLCSRTHSFACTRDTQI